MAAVRVRILGLIGLTVTALVTPSLWASTEVPPEAPLPKLPANVAHALATTPEQKIVLYSTKVEDPATSGAQVRSIRFSADPNTGESKIVTQPAGPNFKRICFHVSPSVQGQIGTIVRQLLQNATPLAARPDSVSLQTGLRSTYAKAMRTRASGTVPSLDGGIRFVAAEHQLNVNGSSCVYLPFASGELEVTWLVYGSPNPSADTAPPVRRADGSMPFRVVRYIPPFVGTEPNQIESGATLIHTAVVDLALGTVIQDRDL